MPAHEKTHARQIITRANNINQWGHSCEIACFSDFVAIAVKTLWFMFHVAAVNTFSSPKSPSSVQVQAHFDKVRSTKYRNWVLNVGRKSKVVQISKKNTKELYTKVLKAGLWSEFHFVGLLSHFWKQVIHNKFSEQENASCVDTTFADHHHLGDRQFKKKKQILASTLLFYTNIITVSSTYFRLLQYWSVDQGPHVFLCFPGDSWWTLE